MLSQLRIRYPTGSLISELLTIHQEKYIVRVIVQVEGVILTTALAAADTIELAEDQAKKRAIQDLGLDTTLSPISLPPEPLKSTVMEVPVQGSSSTPPEPVKTDIFSGVLSSDVSEESLTPRIAEESSFTSDDWLSATYIQPKAEASKSSPEQDTPPSSSTKPKGRGASLPPIPPTTTEALPPYPDELERSSPSVSSSRPLETTDFSSDIAKTDIELKRLGWTPEQGSVYLQKTYGKRSRRLLTDAELLDFLHYLECLPTPTRLET